EEDPIRVASALKLWWSEQNEAIGIVIGTDPQTAAARWAAAPASFRGATLLLPSDAFPGLAAPLRDPIAAAWKKSAGSDPVSALPSGGPAAPLVLLVSAEAPGRLAARVRAMARRPEMKGRLLGVWSLSGPVREDLPALILSEGNLGGLG